MVHPHADEIARLGACRCGAAHCPGSNMRLASGIAPVMAMHAAGMRIGLGVDGSASNDGSHMLGEARQALLLQRLATALQESPAPAMTARQALWFATRGGASVLGRDDIGQLSPGYAADIVGFRLDTLAMAGAAPHDPLAALVFTQPPQVSFSIINGRPRVRDGEILGLDLPSIIMRHNRAATALINNTSL
jgi:cytosine/adenosine deaminase-related metal-dependent hydrolase